MPSHSCLASLDLPLTQSGHQRLWYWRGWRVRYWFHPGPGRPDQPALLLIHGFGANLNQWRQNLAPLSQVAPVYALDLLGFGDTEKPPTLYSAELWAAQVQDFMAAVINRPVILVGHSLGALVALTVAHQQPAQLSRLILVTLPLAAARQDLVAGWIAHIAFTVERLVATPLLIRPLFQLVRQRACLRWVLGRVYLDADRVDDELLSLFALPPRQPGAARALCYLVRSRCNPDFSPSIQAMLRHLALPTLLLWGDRDRVLPVAMASALEDLSPNLTLKYLKGAGHCLYDEDGDSFNQWVRHWAGY
ncbi:MAG: alpha/beta fold hydrolase [Cyanobacteria bacterium REEB459]|nr:alpha/beta fold hydrolase [Cyanobacteria bacterium REEB459]